MYGASRAPYVIIAVTGGAGPRLVYLQIEVGGGYGGVTVLTDFVVGCRCVLAIHGSYSLPVSIQVVRAGCVR